MENHDLLDVLWQRVFLLNHLVGEKDKYFGDFAMPPVIYIRFNPTDKLQLKIQFANIESQMAGASAKICRAQTET